MLEIYTQKNNFPKYNQAYSKFVKIQQTEKKVINNKCAESVK